MKLEVMDKENKKAEDLEIDDNLLKIEVKDDLIHDVVLAHMNNQHTGSSNTKTRAEVRGGGAKPWRQKGTGRARHGSNRSPIWKGGGVTFGPRPGKVKLSVNKDMRKKALNAVIARKLQDKEIIVINDIAVEKPKTKDVTAVLNNLKLKGTKLLMVIDKKDENVIKSARNIKNLNVVQAKNLNSYELLTHPKVLATKKAMEEIIRRIGK